MERINRTGTVYVVVALSFGMIVSGCANRAQSGAGFGAVSGGLVGSLVGPAKNRGENALIGAAVGGLLGYAVGNEMDKSDKAHLNRAYENLPDNKRVEWVNPNTHHRYAVTPRSTSRSESGQYCRQAEIESVIDGKRETVVKMACRRSNGTWEI